MATFFMFGTYSAEAVKGISADRTRQAQQSIESLGGKVICMYALLGQYDLVLVVELPGVEDAVKASIKLNAMSGIAFTTAQAIPVEELDKIAG
jgi:uncharacterized protein with GYD domain